MYVRSSGFYPDTFVKCASRQARVSFSSFISPEFNSGSKHRSLCWMISNKYAALFLTLLRKVSPKMENNLFCIAK